MPTLTISIDEDVKKVISKRAKKNMLSIKEQIEEIVRQSAIRTKAGASNPMRDIDDKLVEVFSRQKRGRRK